MHNAHPDYGQLSTEAEKSRDLSKYKYVLYDIEIADYEMPITHRRNTAKMKQHPHASFLQGTMRVTKQHRAPF